VSDHVEWGRSWRRRGLGLWWRRGEFARVCGGDSVRSEMSEERSRVRLCLTSLPSARDLALDNVTFYF
jgi:hypothetical protein